MGYRENFFDEKVANEGNKMLNVEIQGNVEIFILLKASLFLKI